MNWFHQLYLQIGLNDIFDIIIVSIMLYQVLLIIQGTRAVQMLIGLLLLFVLYWFGVNFELYALNWLLEHFFDSFIVILVILFQDQIRSALASVGGRGLFPKYAENKNDSEAFEEVIEACNVLSKKKIGALIVFERTNGLLNYINTGTKLNSQLHADVLYAIFQSSSPLHDGAVIISHGKISAAGCFLPLSKNIEIDRHLGTRHRAALGVSELTDAVVVTVSEETGKISLCLNGSFYECNSENALRQYLNHIWLNDKLDKNLKPIVIKEAGK